jgi:hypothetical protein
MPNRAAFVSHGSDDGPFKRHESSGYDEETQVYNNMYICYIHVCARITAYDIIVRTRCLEETCLLS